VPGVPALKRVGHKGADLIAPGNTIASFDAALAVGVDMVEFDVLPERADGSGRLVLAHDADHAAAGTPVTLEEGLAHLARADVELDVDLKRSGYEARVVDALRRFGVTERALVSTTEPESLRAVRALAPGLRLGWSVSEARVARQAPRELRAGRIDAIMAHTSVATGRLVRAVREAGGELYVWTVDDAQEVERFERLGVTGVITNDPRLFTRSGTSPPRSRPDRRPWSPRDRRSSPGAPGPRRAGRDATGS
jgi:glycerophosphoryl diester phosphodiesterase